MHSIAGVTFGSGGQDLKQEGKGKEAYRIVVKPFEALLHLSTIPPHLLEIHPVELQRRREQEEGALGAAPERGLVPLDGEGMCVRRAMMSGGGLMGGRLRVAVGGYRLFDGKDQLKIPEYPNERGRRRRNVQMMTVLSSPD